MDISMAIGAIMLHLCPFTHDGKQYSVIPLTEIYQVAKEVEKENAKVGDFHWPIDQMGVIVTTEGCKADDGVHVPGIEEKK